MPLSNSEQLECEFLHHAAEEAEKLLSDMLEEVSDKERNYRFTKRLKGAGSIQNKILRKRQEGEARKRVEGETEAVRKLLTYGPNHVTDAWGCRFITLFQGEIPKTIRALLTALTDYNRKKFYELITMREFVIYTNRPTDDPISIANETFEIVANSAFAEQIKDTKTVIRPPEYRKSAYSSVHFVFEKKFSSPKEGRRDSVSFEVQLRDIFEEGWGQIQHKLLYAEKEDRVLRDVDQLSDEHWKPHLNALKVTVDGCSQHASVIK